MSLRRQSCNACFKGRRKCDRGYPACATCQRTKKSCHYAYAPVLQTHLLDESISMAEDGSSGSRGHLMRSTPGLFTEPLESSEEGSRTPSSTSVSSDLGGDIFGRSPEGPWRHGSSRHQNSPPTILSRSRPPISTAYSIPNFLGGLGELQRIEGSTESWQWVINEFKQFPHDFATRGETLFLHKELYRGVIPPAIRAAMGVSSTFCLLNENNRQMLFRIMDAEVSDLLNPPRSLDADKGGDTDDDGSGASRGMDLLEELARLQAFAMYQMMRMFEGGLEQRAVVNLQQGLITTWALQLLRRSRIELGGTSSATADWHSWIVAESVRRTVMVIYMFYGMYSMAMHGFCIEFPTLAQLPVWTSPESWNSKNAHLVQLRNEKDNRTLAYEAYTRSWAESPPTTLDTFDKFLIVPCKGLESMARYDFRGL